MKKAYIVYIDDGETVMKIHIPAESKEKAAEYCDGVGEIVAVKESKDRTAEDPISLEYIRDALRRSGFGKMEIDLIARALCDCEFIA